MSGENGTDAGSTMRPISPGSPSSTSSRRRSGGRKIDIDNLSPEEIAKRERVRASARERQRKHRAGVKAKRMAELGMAIVNESGDIEQTAIGYTVNGQGQYEAVLAHPNDPNMLQSLPPFYPHQPYGSPGQLFASTLLLGLAWTPRLKTELMRRLRVSNDELSSFENVIAAAFDHWQHERNVRYEMNVAAYRANVKYPDALPRPVAEFYRSLERSASPSEESQVHPDSHVDHSFPPNSQRQYPPDAQMASGSSSRPPMMPGGQS